jgi:hypothetical protein
MINGMILEMIVDGLHPFYSPTSDEECGECDDEKGEFYRKFKHTKSGREYLLSWTVYFGTPETVRTVFHAPEEIK